MFFPATFIKTIFFLTAIEVATLFWLAGGFYTNLKVIWKNLIGRAVVCFFAILLLSALAGVDFYQSLWSNYERMIGFWTLAHIFIFYIILVTTCLSGEEWRRLFLISTMSASIVSIIGINEAILGPASIRIESTINNSAFLASYLLLSFFISLWSFAEESKTRTSRILFGISSVIIFIAMLLTGTRGAFLGWIFGVMCVVGLFLALGPRDLKYKKLRVGLIVGAIVLFGLIISGLLAQEIKLISSFRSLERLFSISFTDKAFQGRVLAWRVSWAGWKERPFLGWGVENYNLLFNSHYDQRLIDYEPWYDRAHNFIFDVGSTSGILGLAAYVSIFIFGLLSLFRLKKSGKISFWTFAILVGALVSHLIQNLLVFDAISSLILFILIFAFIHANSIDITYAKKNKVVKSKYWVIAVGCIILTSVFYTGVWKPFWENRIGKLGYDAFAKAESDDTAIRYTEQALSYDTYGNIDVRRGVAEYVFEYLKQGGRVRDEKSLRRVIEYAIEKMEDNIRERPRDVKWYMYQGQLYNLHATVLGKPDPEYAAKAEKRFLEAAAMSPQRMQIYLEIAQARKVQGNISGVWNAIDRAETLVPEYGVPHVNALVHAIDLGDRSREAQELSWLGEHLVEDRESIRDAYYRVRRFDDAAVTEISIIRNREHDTYDRKELAKEYKNLAIFYKEAGKFTQAREAALRVVELDQSQKASAEAFIQSLKALER